MAPMMRSAQRAPGRVFGLVHSIGMPGGDLRDIKRTAVAVLSQPEEIEDADGAVWAGRTDIRMERERPAEGIGGHPGIAESVPGKGALIRFLSFQRPGQQDEQAHEQAGQAVARWHVSDLRPR